MVNVVRSNFLEKSQDLIDRLPTAAYAAIDLEMTGITIPGTGRPTRDDTPQDRYPKLRPVPERYSIIQVGVALFHENPDYTAWVEAAAAGGGSGEARNDSGGTGGVDGIDSFDDDTVQQQQQQQQQQQPLPPLKYNGKKCTIDNTCEQCEGDCRRDSDCGTGLVCFVRDSKTVGATQAVPGCSTNPVRFFAKDFCVSSELYQCGDDESTDCAWVAKDTDRRCVTLGYLCRETCGYCRPY